MADGALKGQTAVVTGGAGAIGGACAAALAKDGAAVVIMGRKAESLEKMKAKILAQVPGARIECSAGDGMKPEDFIRAADLAVKIANRLDIVVATVGGGGFKPLLMQDVAGFRAELDYNIISTFIAIRYGATRMKNGGSIVAISSTAAGMPFPWLAAYCTAKGGVEHLVRTAADELSSMKIRVNAIRPGLTKSDSAAGMFENPDVLAHFLQQVPAGRGGEPEDIAQGVRYLAGPESSWVTGVSFAVDGGHELRRNPDLTEMVKHMYGAETLAKLQRGDWPDFPE